jgi:hypothetical protein
MQGKSSAVLVHPDKMRGTITLPFGDVVQTFNGTTGAIEAPGQPPMTMPEGMVPEMKRAVLLNAAVGVLREALNGSAQVAALESKPAAGTNVDRVSWKKGDVEMVLGFDQKTHYLVQATYRGMTMQGMADTEQLFSDFKPAANGIVVPMRIVSYQNGQKVVEVNVTEWKFNTGVSLDDAKK